MNPFTFKEKEVLALVSSGLTTKEIASKLNISHHTVETHRKNLLRKCEAKNSVELVQKALMQQMLAVWFNIFLTRCRLVFVYSLVGLGRHRTVIRACHFFFKPHPKIGDRKSLNEIYQSVYFITFVHDQGWKNPGTYSWKNGPLV